jgi:DNA-directed RNA polymerase specialized sigma24 family protein
MGNPEGSITRYYGDFVKSRDETAARKLWERHESRLIRLARSHLQAAARRMADEEDVALSAFDSFCAGAVKGRFPRVEDRGDLWKILVKITVRKAADLAKHESRRRPKDRKLLAEAELVRLGAQEPSVALQAVAGSEPSPEFAATVAEQCSRLLSALEDDKLRQIALDRLAGYRDGAIAARLGCTRRTVLRKLTLIRNAWRKELEP